MNDTFNVGTIFHCDKLLDNYVMDKYYMIWAQTVAGCKIVQLLQDIHKFNISYDTYRLESNETSITGKDKSIYPWEGDNIDVYVRPMILRPELLDYCYPVQAICKWRFGFMLRRPEPACLFKTFYSKPFTQPLWNGLYGMAFIITLLLYLLKKWEAHLYGYVPEEGITYEMLMVFGAYCQHIPPLNAVLLSRRTVYFVFFMFAYVIYSFYTSNLLSHLVNDKGNSVDLESLAKSEHDFAIINDLKIYQHYNLSFNLDQISANKEIAKKLQYMKTVTISEGLAGVTSGKTALLSDYRVLYPHLKYKFDSDVLCKLTMVDLLTNINKYFFTSKNFKYKEEFKISILRAFETGVLKRLVFNDFDLPPMNCKATRLIQAQILQISSLLCVLMCLYLLAVIILIGERIHYKRNRLWPYVD